MNRLLHRTAPNTTADCAVPPLPHQLMRVAIVPSKRDNIGDAPRGIDATWAVVALAVSMLFPMAARGQTELLGSIERDLRALEPGTSP